MRRTLQTLVVLAMFATPAFADDRVAGTVVAIDGDAYTVDLGGEAAVSSGTELQVYRRLPSGRGTAAYRDSPVWWEVGRLTVRAVGEGIAIAVWSGPPSDVLPSGLDESGAPPDQVHIGDRVRATGSIGARPARVRVSFALRDLFEPQSQDLQGEGSALLAEWLRGIRSIEGPLEIEVHPRIAELGEVGPDLSRELSREIDAPFGPAPGEPVVPVDGLYEGAPTPVLIPEGREVLVVDQRDGKPDVWHYLDPVTMARRQGERVASALVGMGLGPGERVAILGENCLEWCLADYAIMSAGLVSVPLYTSLPTEQIAYILEDSEARAIVVWGEDQAAKMAGVQAACPQLAQ